jgi:FAD/FMN-containing dehydrogenase
MGAPDLPAPVIRRPTGAPVDTASLEAALRERVDGEVRFDAGSRAAYATDASNFRQTPIGVVVPSTPEAAVEAVAVAREHGAPVLSRGGGTSLAGQCANTTVVIDWSKYCNRLESVDPEARTTVRHLAEHVRAGGLVVGLEPSCTAVFRADAGELFPGDLNVRRLRDRTVTLAELLTEHTPGYEPPHVPDRSARALAQCTATSTRCSAGTPTGSCRAAPGSTRSGWSPAAAAWPATAARARSPGRQQGVRATRAAAAAVGGGRGDGGPRRRLQLPYPDP